MKKNEKMKINFEKFTISKLNGMSKIIGGNNTDGNTLLPESSRACKDRPE